MSYPPQHRTRPDLCAEHGHPGVTYNPWFGPEGRTWCLCGEVVTEGGAESVNERIVAMSALTEEVT